jgi:hypothetical protein
VSSRERFARSLLAAAWLQVPSDPPAAPDEPSRRYEIYSNVQDREGDLEGMELDLFFWEDNAVDGTLMVYRRLVDTKPVRLRGTRRNDEVSLSITREQEILEIRGTRSEKRFVGQMVHKMQGKVVRTTALNLPRRKL